MRVEGELTRVFQDGVGSEAGSKVGTSPIPMAIPCLLDMVAQEARVDCNVEIEGWKLAGVREQVYVSGSGFE